MFGWNAKIDKDNVGWDKTMGKFGYGDRIERREKLLELVIDKDLFICNPKFQQKDCCKWT